MNQTFRNLLIISVLAICVTACGGKNKPAITVDDINNPATADGKASNDNLPVITFERSNYDFGKVTKGERLTYAFKFTNTGKSNLIISSTRASCGCTTSIPPKEPIRPGESGEIKVTFDSKNKHGKVTNTVIVSANTQPVSTIIQITADVILP